MRRILLAITAIFGTASGAFTQTPPSPSEIGTFSPLFLAAHGGTAQDIQQVLAGGAEVSETDEKGRTAVHIAAFASNTEALGVLAAAGADMNALEYQLYDAVTIASVANDPETLRAALAAGNRADLITSVYEGTALIAAAHLGHHEVVGILIEAGAPLDHINNLGWTALMESVVLGDGGPNHVATARLLLEAGADPDIGDRSGATPADHARQRGYTEMIALFERFGR